MKLTINPGHALTGTVSLPGDKSLSHRAALIASMAAGRSQIDNFLVSGVTSRLLEALTSLGITWRLDGTTLILDGKGLGGFSVPFGPLNCGNSASTMRFLAGALAAAGTPAVLDGSLGLRRRPMDRIIQPLNRMGVNIKGAAGYAPLSMGVSALPLKGGTLSLDVASAQVKTCLLLAGLSAGDPVTISEPGFSRDHTERMLSSMGVTIKSEKISVDGFPRYLTHLAPPTARFGLKPLNMALPGDFSSASFLIVAALITPGSNITLKDIGLNATRTGLLDVLLTMGASIQINAKPTRNGEPVGDLTIKYSNLKAVDICGEKVVRMIDEFPIFAIAAAYASGTSTVRDAAELRVKESDRIGALCSELRNIGVEVMELPDGFAINGIGEVRGGTVEPHGDHRLAMSLAVAGLASAQPVAIQNAEILRESFPEFSDVITRLGGELISDETPVLEKTTA
ncbi:MAG: 3-phosphoshikimate 1-carboxyvinyltransferase [Chloroflexi bacterium]|jgi:3-phosphoshikimate 1-carboxyvinyltransferase|nr:3-phosphoshikimate 1-carboxyvinyltransferase [Chloroflexota bacterium]BCY17568.1 3-phosphoshikimate 1-carboxyvinyltransferase [Leptolinea sp. HRD-7]